MSVLTALGGFISGPASGAHGVFNANGTYICYQAPGQLCNYGYEGYATPTAAAGANNVKQNVSTALSVHNSSGGNDLGPAGNILISSPAGTNAYTGSIGLITAYEVGATYCMIVPNNNTSGTVTWNLNSIGAEPFKNHAGNNPSTVPAELVQNLPTCATWDGTNFDNNSSIGSGGTIASTTNVIKGDGSGNGVASSIVDSGSAPTKTPNGLDTVTAGVNHEISNSIAGTGAQKLVCRNSSGQAVTCPTSTTSGVEGVANGGAGSSGVVTTCYTTGCVVLFDNTSAIGDWAIPLTTVAGELHDTGSTSQTGGVQNFYVTSVNSGAGTTATVDILTPDVVSNSIRAAGGISAVDMPGDLFSPATCSGPTCNFTKTNQQPNYVMTVPPSSGALIPTVLQ